MYRFHEITLTSASCALKETAGDLPSLVSHIDIVPSTEQEANTSASVGLHYKDRSNGIHNSITFSISYIFQKIKCQGILVNLQHLQCAQQKGSHQHSMYQMWAPKDEYIYCNHLEREKKEASSPQ